MEVTKIIYNKLRSNVMSMCLSWVLLGLYSFSVLCTLFILSFHSISLCECKCMYTYNAYVITLVNRCRCVMRCQHKLCYLIFIYNVSSILNAKGGKKGKSIRICSRKSVISLYCESWHAILCNKTIKQEWLCFLAILKWMCSTLTFQF